MDNLNLIKMFDAPSVLTCPKCQKLVDTHFDYYDIDDGKPNEIQGQWYLAVMCDGCGHTWLHCMDLAHPFNAWAVAVAKCAEDHGFHKAGVNSDAASWCANLHGEVSEFWEAYRRGKLESKCDKDVPLSCAEEELADIIIRVLDVAYRLKIDMDRAVRLKHEYNLRRPYLHGGKKA